MIKMISFILISICVNIAVSHKILVFSPATSKSHMISNGRIADELVKAGHDVILLEPDFLDLTDKYVNSKLAKRWPVTGLSNGKFKEIQSELSEHIFHKSSLWDQIFDGMDQHNVEYTKMCEEVVTNTELMSKLKNEKFEAYFGEQINLCGMGLAHLLQIPRRFWVSSCTMGVGTRKMWGLDTPTSFLPMTTSMDPTPAPIWQRARNMFSHMLQNYNEEKDNALTAEMFRRNFGPDFPSVEHLARESDVVFVASEELLDIVAPTLPNVVHIGGLGINDDHDGLDEKFDAEMQKGAKGVVYFSLGTIANTTSLPDRIMSSLLDITQNFGDYHFLIRADKHDKKTFEHAKKLPNVLVSDWFPQPAILAHPRLKMFITHGGYNSIMEAARAGVPLVTIPFMFDQPRNSRSVERKGWGIARDKSQLADEPNAIEGAIKEILTNEKYTLQAQRLKSLIRSKPQNASERFIKTVEWVLQNGGIEELKYEGRNLSNIIYFNIDVIIGCFSIVVTILMIIINIYYVIFGRKNTHTRESISLGNGKSKHE